MAGAPHAQHDPGGSGRPAAGPDDAELRAWAPTLDGRLVTLFHEPSTDGQPAGDFVAAWRHAVRTVEATGSRPVWVFNTTWTSIVHGEADAWWPGGRWVDAVSAEDYDWHGCLGKASTTFASKLRAMLRFADAHGRLPVVVGEWGRPAGPGRASW